MFLFWFLVRRRRRGRGGSVVEREMKRSMWCDLSTVVDEAMDAGSQSVTFGSECRVEWGKRVTASGRGNGRGTR